MFGDTIDYFIARRWGEGLLTKIGFRKFLSSQKFLDLKNKFLKHYFSTIFFSRWLVSGLGAPVNVVAGLLSMKYKKFLVPEVPGQLIYVALYVGLGFFLGSEWQYISGIFENISWALLLIAIVFIVIIVFESNKKPIS